MKKIVKKAIGGALPVQTPLRGVQPPQITPQMAQKIKLAMALKAAQARRPVAPVPAMKKGGKAKSGRGC